MRALTFTIIFLASLTEDLSAHAQSDGLEVSGPSQCSDFRTVSCGTSVNKIAGSAKSFSYNTRLENILNIPIAPT